MEAGLMKEFLAICPVPNFLMSLNTKWMSLNTQFYILFYLHQSRFHLGHYIFINPASIENVLFIYRAL